MPANAQAMPARTIERVSAGPAFWEATIPVYTKIPAPMTAPIPRVTRASGPSSLLRVPAPASASSVCRSFRTKSDIDPSQNWMRNRIQIRTRNKQNGLGAQDGGRGGPVGGAVYWRLGLE